MFGSLADNARSKFDLEVVSQNFVYLPKYSHNISFLSYCGKFQKGFLSLDVFLTLSKVKPSQGFKNNIHPSAACDLLGAASHPIGGNKVS